MRRYAVHELKSPRVYQEDPVLAAFARRVAAGRWTARLGTSLAEWKAEHLVGRHATMIACALEAYLGYVEGTGAPAQSHDRAVA